MMDCNSDEALRAREIAEKKFAAKDIIGAKKFAIKAQKLYPDLDGISQMISTLNVHLSAEAVINGERDWYGILSVNATADDEMVKKQYRKLALMLHPDKNKSVGAESAFKFISEAWSVLSDRNRRLVYDQKMNIRGTQQKSSQAYGSLNGFYHFANSTATNLRTQKSSARSRVAASVKNPPTAHPPKPNTFWTSCNRCKMQYEYLRIYLNSNLLCPNCHEPFLAIEIANPMNGSNPSVRRSSSQQHVSHKRNAYGHGSSTGFQYVTNIDFGSSNFHWGAFSRTAGAASAAASSSAAAQAANMVHQTYEKVRREREEKQAAARRVESVENKLHTKKNSASIHVESSIDSFNGFTSDQKHPVPSKEDKPAKKRRSISNYAMNDCARNASEGKAGNANFNSDIGVNEMERSNGISADSAKARGMHRQIKNLSRDLSYLDIRSLLMQKAKKLIQKNLDVWNSAGAAKIVESEMGRKQKEHDKEKEAVPPSEIKSGKCSDNAKEVHGNKALSGKPCSDSFKEVLQPVSVDVLDPDFYDFDKDRLERSFEPDQVWATYDNEDGMPRFYVMIQKVISSKPFKIRVSSLKSKTNSEFSQLNWVSLGFAKTCGEFRSRNYEVRDTINIFSHKVKWEKGARGIVRIVPRKGDTWALYRNWSFDWNEHTPDDTVYKYDMVEVVEDYNAEQGVTVVPLVKVAGFKTVFHRHMDLKEVRRIPKEEMYRFSHQVPSYMLTGEESGDAPKGCLELDPAATPFELLQVITEAKGQEQMEICEQETVC